MNRAQQEIAIARREATRIAHERAWKRVRQPEADMVRLAVAVCCGRTMPKTVTVSGGLLLALMDRYRLTEALRDAVWKAVARTGLEPVEAAKMSECHELLSEIVG